jgi:hypothetical protein
LVAPLGAEASFWIVKPGATFGFGAAAAVLAVTTPASDRATPVASNDARVRRLTELWGDAQAW